MRKKYFAPTKTRPSSITGKKRAKFVKLEDLLNMNYNRASMGKRLRFHRMRQNITLSAIGLRLGVHPTFLSQVERDKVGIRLSLLKHWATMLNIRPCDLNL